jgi:hypothetical protein
MRAIGYIIAFFVILSSIGFGIIDNVHPPYVRDVPPNNTSIVHSPVDHGTKTPPSEIPLFVDLYFYSIELMNTSITTSVVTEVSFPGSTISFLLQKELINDFKIENPMAAFPMTARVYLSGSGTVNVTVRDSAGPIVGSVIYPSSGQFSFGNTPQPVDITIPFSSGDNYTFSSGNIIEVDFNFTNTGRIHYGSTTAPSRLQLYGSTITDITIATKNFFGEFDDRFYPNDIDFPFNRIEVNIEGIITEVFGKEGSQQYVDLVQVQIQGPGYDQTYQATYDSINYQYIYTWNYPPGQAHGEYTITTHVFDEQGNEFTVIGFFNMSQYGVLLTSPSQVPEEGVYKAEAKRNVIQYTKIIYTINVRNIGNEITIVNLTTLGPGGWDWWLEGENLTYNNGSKTDTVLSIQPGEKREVYLVVDSMDRSLGEMATIIVSATCSEDATESSSLVTKTHVISYPLLPGWNLISVPFIQSNSNLSSVLSPIDGSYDAVQWFNVSDTPDPWKHHHISKPSHLNDLTDINHTIGFWIHIIDPGYTYFDYNGIPPSSNQTIQLHEGWNMIGYPSLRGYNRTAGLNNLIFGTDIDAIQWYDTLTGTWHLMGPNDTFEIGRGYWMHSKDERAWEVPL